MNFSAFEYWTDGWDDGSLMTRDYGIRLCSCGCFVLRREMADVGNSKEADAPSMDYVLPSQIDECIATAASQEIEVAARRYRWHELNHSYRNDYRTHRNAEEASIQSIWEAENPDRRSLWQRITRREAPVYLRPKVSITFPEFFLSSAQAENMTKLLELLITTNTTRQRARLLEVPELYRELGRYSDAQRAIESVPHEYDPVARRLISGLIGEKKSALVRFRY